MFILSMLNCLPQDVMYGRKVRNMCPVHAVYSRDDSSAFAVKARNDEKVNCEAQTEISMLVITYCIYTFLINIHSCATYFE